MSIPPRFADNAASLVAWLDEILPPAAVGAQMRVPGDPGLLFAEEAVHLGRAVPKRAAEFAAGRLCARRALTELGLQAIPIKAAADRQPIWPPGFVGSITHTDGICLAAVAAVSQLAAIGLDTETVGHVTREVWGSICVSSELTWLDTLQGFERDAAAALVFSAKEAVYKCQYPLTGEWMDFGDLRLELPDWGRGSSGGFLAHPTRTLKILDRAAPPFSGRYRFHDGYVTAGMAMQAADLQ